MRETVDPSNLVGCTLTGAIVGWHQFEASRTRARLFLEAGDSIVFEVQTAGSGSLELIRTTTPTDFDMEELGSFVFAPADSDDLVHGLLGNPLLAVRPIRWRGVVVGLRFEAENMTIVLFNEADEIFTSDGEFPPDYADAVVDS